MTQRTGGHVRFPSLQGPLPLPRWENEVRLSRCPPSNPPWLIEDFLLQLVKMPLEAAVSHMTEVMMDVTARTPSSLAFYLLKKLEYRVRGPVIRLFHVTLRIWCHVSIGLWYPSRQLPLPRV